jgi:hypothetical protein
MYGSGGYGHRSYSGASITVGPPTVIPEHPPVPVVMDEGSLLLSVDLTKDQRDSQWPVRHSPSCRRTARSSFTFCQSDKRNRGVRGAPAYGKVTEMFLSLVFTGSERIPLRDRVRELPLSVSLAPGNHPRI